MKISLAKLATVSLATFAALMEATATILEKKVLRKHKVSSITYVVLSFLAIVLLSIPVFFVLTQFFPHLFSWRIGLEAFQLKNILILSGVVILAIFANLFVFYALKWEKISELEPILITQSLFIILFAFTFYASERQTPYPVLIAALVASAALIFSHIRKHHLQFSKYAVAALFGNMLFASELVLSKSLLGYYSPLSFYFVRCGIILIITSIIFAGKIQKVSKISAIHIGLAALIWIIYRAILYYSYGLKGIIFTTLLFMLAPVFVYLFSYIYLKEKPTWRNIVASIIILLCVLYATFANGF
jgi:drug/metabolite transporter (DMT)-like permease